MSFEYWTITEYYSAEGARTAESTKIPLPIEQTMGDEDGKPLFIKQKINEDERKEGMYMW